VIRNQTSSTTPPVDAQDGGVRPSGRHNFERCARGRCSSRIGSASTINRRVRRRTRALRNACDVRTEIGSITPRGRIALQPITIRAREVAELIAWVCPTRIRRTARPHAWHRCQPCGPHPGEAVIAVACTAGRAVSFQAFSFQDEVLASAYELRRTSLDEDALSVEQTVLKPNS
jgi:hypothetical protein